MNIKEFFRKHFPSTRNMTDKQLTKEVKSNKALQTIMLALCVVFASFFAFVPDFKTLAVFEQMAFVGVITAGIALSFAMFAQYRIFEAEASFELRLREALVKVKEAKL